ncbi:MAG: hypothetical protein WC530_07705 [Candidatus Omnitrophota bacterium]|jgi:hypothetical protein
MAIIYCTRKVVKEAGLSEAQLAKALGEDLPIGSWHVHLFFRRKEKCLIFTNTRTLYSFVVENVKRADVRDLAPLFRKELNRSLFYEEFSAEAMGEVARETGTVQFARASNRSVLSSMNDLIRQHDGYTETLEEKGREDLVAVNRQINRTPMGAMQYAFPVERFKELLGIKTDKKKERVYFLGEWTKEMNR